MNEQNGRIEISGLEKSFGKQPVLRGVDWSIAAGSVVGLLGTNGAGKTTLIRCLLGMLRADSGHALIDGEDAWDLSSNTKARIGYVDQRPQFYPWLNGSDLLQYVGAMYPNWNDALCTELAEQWNVPLSKAFGKLSPGEQQKIAILTAMGNEPDLLVLDEPVSSLDPLARRAFLKSLLAIARETDRTILFRHTSHQTLNALPPTSRSCMKARFNGLTNWMSPRNESNDFVFGPTVIFRNRFRFPVRLPCKWTARSPSLRWRQLPTRRSSRFVRNTTPRLKSKI